MFGSLTAYSNYYCCCNCVTAITRDNLHWLASPVENERILLEQKFYCPHALSGRPSAFGLGRRHYHHAHSTRCAETAVPVKMQLGMLSQVGPGNHVLNGGGHCHHLVNAIEPSVCDGNAALCQVA